VPDFNAGLAHLRFAIRALMCYAGLTMDYGHYPIPRASLLKP